MIARPVVFGEVLYDCFPDGRRVLGGAPFNVAWHLQAFGMSPMMVSRVGDDEAGMAVLDAMREWGMDRRGLQIDRELPTGEVQVRFAQGEPEYEIVHPSAWDAIGPPDLDAAGSAVYHGSLALRDARSAAGLLALLGQADAPVFLDVNLRAPWWETGAVLERARDARWVKLNAGELQLLGGDGPVEEVAARFLADHQLAALVVTRGAEGAVVMLGDGRIARAQPPRVAELRDTVGAGDAFSAVMMTAFLKDWPLDLALARALEFAAAICGRRGAIVRERSFYQPFLDRWGIDTEAFIRV